MDRLEHFTINVNHTAGKLLALTGDLSRNPIAQPQTDGAYDDEYVINNNQLPYKFFRITVALAAIPTKYRAERTKARAKLITGYGQQTPVNKASLIAIVTHRTHALTYNLLTKCQNTS